MVHFNTAAELSRLIDAYFNYIEGEYHFDNKQDKEGKGQQATDRKVWAREPEPATIAGLAFSLGFTGRVEFDDYCTNGAYRHILSRGQLRIEACYEKKLHNTSPSGAIFALKNLGWNEKAENKTESQEIYKTLKVELIESGPKPAENEKAVIL